MAEDYLLGFAAVAAAVARDHGNPSLAADLCRCAGISLDDLEQAGVEAFDLAPLRSALATSASEG